MQKSSSVKPQAKHGSSGSASLQHSEREEDKSMSDIVMCFGPTIREYLNVKELMPNLIQSGLANADVLQQLHTKLNSGLVSREEACTELFDLLRADIGDTRSDLATGKLFVFCLKHGDVPVPENRILAKFIEGTGRIPAHDIKEQEFRKKFIAELHNLRGPLSSDHAFDTLFEVLGDRGAFEIINRTHDGSIDRFLLLVFTLGRHPDSIRNGITKYLLNNGIRKAVAERLGAIKPRDNVDEEDVRSFQEGFSSLGYMGDGDGDVAVESESVFPIGPIEKAGVEKELKSSNANEKDVDETELTDHGSPKHQELETKEDSPDTRREEKQLRVLLPEDAEDTCKENDYASSGIQGEGQESEAGSLVVESAEPEQLHTGRPDTAQGDAGVETREKGAIGGESEEPAFYSSLRKYQLELAEPSLKGVNSIIVAPTGTGKTHVAAYVINEHFIRLKKEDDLRTPKVVFVVHTKVLADQQLKKLEELIGSQDKKILSATGDKMDIPLAQILATANVVVLTAQVLLNGLAEGLDQVRIDELTLLIFDECHNCHKGHPFNQIMHQYHTVKRKLIKKGETKLSIKGSLPQIIGMTASIGTGKSKSTDKAFEHIVETCANLDTEKVQDVRDKEDLQKHLNIPEEIDPHIVPPRKEDPFRETLERIMVDIEKKLKNAFEGRVERGQVGGVAITCNGQRDSQIYEAWVKKFEKASVNITVDGDEQELVSSCLYNLLAYNRGLCLNRDVRMKDALNFLKETFRERRPIKGECNTELLKRFDEKVRSMERLCMEDRENPVLGKLREIIVMEFEQKPYSRALLFTPTVQSTKALKDWIMETRDFENLHLNPGRVTGATELTNAERDNAVRKFRSGEHKLLVVTNVVEQGMDVPECNLVIRLNYIPSDTGHIQVKGRNRAKGGKSYLVASAGHGNFKNRELSNRIRETMMGRLLQILKQMDPDEFAKRVRKVQDKSYQIKEREEKRSKEDEATYDDGIEYTLKCFNCKTKACSSWDVVCLRTYHTVDKENFVKTKIEVALHENRPPAGFEVGIVRCRRCKQQWGTWVKFQNLKFASIHINNFMVTNTDNDQSSCYKQWKDIPFTCREVEDLREELQKIHNLGSN